VQDAKEKRGLFAECAAQFIRELCVQFVLFLLVKMAKVGLMTFRTFTVD